MHTSYIFLLFLQCKATDASTKHQNAAQARLCNDIDEIQIDKNKIVKEMSMNKLRRLRLFLILQILEKRCKNLSEDIEKVIEFDNKLQKYTPLSCRSLIDKKNLNTHEKKRYKKMKEIAMNCRTCIYTLTNDEVLKQQIELAKENKIDIKLCDTVINDIVEAKLEDPNVINLRNECGILINECYEICCDLKILQNELDAINTSYGELAICCQQAIEKHASKAKDRSSSNPDTRK